MTNSDRVVVLTFWKLFGLYLLSAVFGLPIFAQAAAEAASASSVASTIATSPKPMVMPKSVPTNASPASTHLPAALTSPSPETNRRNLEAKAGKDAAKLLIRSTLAGAQVWIDGKPVGTAPLLVIVAPGRYEIELRGQRTETARSVVALLPKEIREANIKLELRYPNRVTLH